MARPKGHIRKRGERYEIAVPLGRDPITKRYRYAYAYAGTEDDARQERDRILDRVAAGREPDSKATVGLLLDRWLAVADLEFSTRQGHESYIRRSIRPALGDWQLQTLQHRVDVIDQLYMHLKRCRNLCDGRPYVEKHATDEPHDCGASRCRWHVCRPMRPRSIRQVHAILRASFDLAVKWGWMQRNPAQYASPPEIAPSEIRPPEPEQAARLVEAAGEIDRALGVFVWLAIVIGARRGELCALRWSDIRGAEKDLLIARAYLVRTGQRAIKDTKTHQRRRLALDDLTLELLGEHRQRVRELAEEAGVDLGDDSYVFSRDGFGEEPWLPDTVTHQFHRAARQAGVACRLHDLRHYTATQMITAGSTCAPSPAGSATAAAVPSRSRSTRTGPAPPTSTPPSCWPSSCGATARRADDAASRTRGGKAMTARQLLRILRCRGCVEVRRRGSHAIMRCVRRSGMCAWQAVVGTCVMFKSSII